MILLKYIYRDFNPTLIIVFIIVLPITSLFGLLGEENISSIDELVKEKKKL